MNFHDQFMKTKPRPFTVILLVDRYKTWRYSGGLGGNKRENGWSGKYGSFYPFYDNSRNLGSDTRFVPIHHIKATMQPG